MGLDKVVFGFFIVLALTLNFSFFLGDMDNPAYHHEFELFAALIVSLIATVMKFGDRSHLGAVFLSTSLVADLHLITAALVWGITNQISAEGMTPQAMTTIVSLSGGALLANLLSVVLLIAETMTVRR